MFLLMQLAVILLQSSPNTTIYSTPIGDVGAGAILMAVIGLLTAAVTGFFGLQTEKVKSRLSTLEEKEKAHEKQLGVYQKKIEAQELSIAQLQARIDSDEIRLQRYEEQSVVQSQEIEVLRKQVATYKNLLEEKEKELAQLQKRIEEIEKK